MTTLEKIRAEIEDLDDVDYDFEGYYKAVTDALQIIDKYNPQEEEWHKAIVEAFEPCEDAISREDAIQNIYKWFDSSDIKSAVPHIEKCLNELPPVRPQEPKAGHWIETEYHRWKCSVCREKGMSEWDNIHDVRTNFCPNCGCRMVEPQKRSE